MCRFPKGVPWVRYHGIYKDLHINIVQPGKDPVLGALSFLIEVYPQVSSFLISALYFVIYMTCDITRVKSCLGEVEN